MTANVNYGSAAAVTARMPSPKIWADCPVLQFLADPAKGWLFWDDFVINDIVFADGVLTSRWICDVDSSCSLPSLNDPIGAKVFTHDGTDNDCVQICSGDNVAGMVTTPTAGEGKRFWFEVRFKVNTITTDDMCTFIGFAAPTLLSTTGLIADTTAALADVDYLGFYVDDGDGDDLTIVYNEATDGTAQSDTGEITLAADTYVRVGMRLDVITDKIHIYVNGVDQGADAEIDIDSVNFPSNTTMAIYILSKMMGGAAADTLTLDWVRFAQEY